MCKFELFKVVIHPLSFESSSRVPTSLGWLKGNRKDKSFQMMKPRSKSKKVIPRGTNCLFIEENTRGSSRKENAK